MTSVILITVFVIGLNGLWYWIKLTLKSHDYEVSWFWNHFRDIPNIFRLAQTVENKSEKTKYRTMGISLILGIISFPIIVFSTIPTMGDNRCSFQEYFDQREWNGTVTDKYLDSKNHNYETLKLSSNTQTIEVQDLVTDWNNSYNSIQVGDTLIKRIGDNFVTVYRTGQEKRLIVDCGCRE